MATIIKQELSPSWNGVRLINLNERVGNLLREIEKVPGVQAAGVFDNHGQFLGTLTSGAIDKGEYNKVGASIAQCFAAFQAKNECRDLEFRFEKKWLYSREIGDAFVVVFCAPKVNFSMLRMTLNVAAVEFINDPDLQKSLKNVAASKQDTLAQNYLDVLGSQLVEQANLLK
ncbi:MAG: hypothetical protein HZB51_21625 [Chloroflexi bacterium]|nr:hypothetical protein [Chloroflexota bacterium]